MTVLNRRTFCGLAAGSLMAAETRYPLYTAKGTHRELGRQHGEQAAAKIAAHLDLIRSSAKLSRAGLNARALRFQALFDRYCPHLVEEIRGLGEGARVSFGEAMAVNIRGGLGQVAEEGCTAYVIGRSATARKSVLAGQNSDITTDIPPLGYVLHLKPLNKPEVLMWTYGGMIGYHGMNSAGVAHFANALGGGPADRFGMPHYPVKRMMLECSMIDQILSIMRKVPLSSNGNYVVCDGQGRIADIEATTAGPELIEDRGAGYLAHSNHFLCPRYATKENHAQGWQDSFPRLDRIQGLLKARAGSLTVDDIKGYLRDHSGYPTSICRHDGASVTVASIISEPAERRMHVAFGNPCQHEYGTYSL